MLHAVVTSIGATSPKHFKILCISCRIIDIHEYLLSRYCSTVKKEQFMDRKMNENSDREIKGVLKKKKESFWEEGWDFRNCFDEKIAII